MKNTEKYSLENEIKEGSGIMEAVDIAIFNEKNQVLLGKRIAVAEIGTWGFPGGHLKTNETIIECAKREVKEEVGDDISVEVTDEVLAVRENCIAPQRIHHVTIIVKGIHKKGKPKVMEPDRCEKWEWFDLDNLPSPLFSGVEDTLGNYKKGISAIVSDW
ncbi:MAG: NUDIX domain-containing protein [Patescibacteria group bacterium]|nr:NUDIX domain-containing protein [Patescibacteria group bacterium]